jgi:hypothetical protein
MARIDRVHHSRRDGNVVHENSDETPGSVSCGGAACNTWLLSDYVYKWSQVFRSSDGVYELRVA